MEKECRLAWTPLPSPSRPRVPGWDPKTLVGEETKDESTQLTVGVLFLDRRRFCPGRDYDNGERSPEKE